MFPNNRRPRSFQSVEILFREESGNYCDNHNFAQFLIAAPIARFIATLFHTFESVQLYADGFCLDKYELTIPFSSHDDIRLLAGSAANFSLFGILAEFDVCGLFNLTSKR